MDREIEDIVHPEIVRVVARMLRMGVITYEQALLVIMDRDQTRTD